jgi:hypothetical protein
VGDAGERAAKGALAETLGRIHESFDRQMKIELELFAQLRALRGSPLTSTGTSSATGMKANDASV